MIDAGPSLDAAKALSAAAMARYLEATGWSVEPSRVGGLTIHAKLVPDTEEPIRIVLPDTQGLDDERRRVADALRTLEAVEERPVQKIADDVWRVGGGTANAS